MGLWLCEELLIGNLLELSFYLIPMDSAEA